LKSYVIKGIGVNTGDDDRQGAAGGKVQRLDLEKRAHRESRAIPAPDANAELAVSMKVILFFFMKRYTCIFGQDLRDTCLLFCFAKLHIFHLIFRMDSVTPLIFRWLFFSCFG